MYETHWRLKYKPFDSDAAEAYYPSETHQGALLKLRYALECRRPAAALAGNGGSGKSLVARALKAQLPAEFSPFVHIVFPQLPAPQLISYLAERLGATTPSTTLTLEQTLAQLEEFLLGNQRQGQHAVVVIDEAHLLEEVRVFDALRLLLNFGAEGKPALTLLLVGQPRLLVQLDRLPSFDERLGVKCLLKPLSLEETISYVEHRLTAAGAKSTIFEQDSWETLFNLTQGLPRRINRLCDLALLIGFAEDRSTITAAHLDAVHEELVAVAAE